MSDTKHEAAVKKEALARKYYEKIRAYDDNLKKTLTKEQYGFFQYYGAYMDETVFKDFKSALQFSDVKPSEYIQKNMSWIFPTVIPESQKKVIYYYADRVRDYIYDTSPTRRSFRSPFYVHYISLITSMLRSFTFGRAVDEELDKILIRDISEDALAYYDVYAWEGSGYNAWQIAYALDTHNENVEEAVKRILTEENSSGRLTTELIRGILYSSRKDYYDLLGKLLLAARLQEGLRQAICENADCGTAEGFLTILRVIDENDLIRFSSVKRAVGTWLGLISEDIKAVERISNKSVRLIVNCLNDSDVRGECLASEDAMKIYVSLWSYGFENLEVACRQAEELSKTGSHLQLLTAGYFIANLGAPYFSNKVAKTVLKAHSDKEDVLAVWLPCFFPNRVYELLRSFNSNTSYNIRPWFDGREEVTEFFRIVQKIYKSVKAKEKVFSPCIFPWHEAKLIKSDLASLLCILAVLCEDDGMIDSTCALLKECPSHNRESHFRIMLSNPKTETQRQAVLEAVADKESLTRRSASETVLKMRLSENENRFVEGLLRFKGEDVRATAFALLLRQSDASLKECIERLLGNGKEEVRIGALDMLMQLQKSEDRKYISKAFYPKLRVTDKATDKEKLMIQSILSKDESDIQQQAELFSQEDKYLPDEIDEAYTKEALTVYMEYFPDSELPYLIGGKKREASILQRVKAAISQKGISVCLSAQIAAKDLMSLSEFVDTHKNDIYTDCYGQEQLVGNMNYGFYRSSTGEIACPELWKEWVSENGITNARVLRALIMFKAYSKEDEFVTRSAPLIRALYGGGFEHRPVLQYSNHISCILDYLFSSIPASDLRKMAFAVAVWFMRCVPNELVMLYAPDEFYHNVKIPRHRAMAHILAHQQIYYVYKCLDLVNDSSFSSAFPVAVAASERCIAAFCALPIDNSVPDNFAQNYKYERSLCEPYSISYRTGKTMVGICAYLIAAYKGIISKRALYQFIFDPSSIRESFDWISNIASAVREKDMLVSHSGGRGNARRRATLKWFLGHDNEWSEDERNLLNFVIEIYDTVIPIVLDGEYKRGNSPAKYTNGVFSISRIYGVEYFASILSAMGNDSLYAWNNRANALCHLLSVCIPNNTDTAEKLCHALDGKNVSTKRLIEAALYSPEWIPIVGEFLNIPAFESVCYYFIAHMNEHFDDKRRAIIARYTPLTQEELNEGAFDTSWFHTAYSLIGEKEFNFIYDAAKYISNGTNHTRARKYADAALGKLDISQTEALISDKRNKDLLMAYSLIPLKDEDDVRARYLFIQKFRKESKQFGSQRIISEGKAVEMALTNLAINAGYSDTMRLTLRMEVKLIDDMKDLLKEHIIDGVSFSLVIGEDGKSGLAISKGGKALKSIPAKLKKNETVVALGEMKKMLTEQYRRTKVMLEEAMENSAEFTMDEISSLFAHPVVYPMIKNLVFISGDISGLPVEGGLSDHNGDVHKIADDAKVRIAHPLELYKCGQWQNYQRYLFKKQIVQPFRQVFRELYIKTADEADAYHSLRYAGNQIQAAKTVATLKGRRWVADIEDGLQKIYYKENIVAQIYALADWFSPADIEAPTLEWVCFSDRKTGNQIKISDVPDVIFSEVMRDVDLAVSVAHAGGVDPEASHSTVEMRSALISFMLPLFGLKNVKLIGSHALISGQLADYSVHLGSGVVHQVGGAMIPVLPVHSQHRGRIFLPFADDDPKTAEIVSKILLFAEDTKIKDPAITSAISIY